MMSVVLPLRAEDEGTLCINEIQVANLDQFVDPSRNYGAWIEIYSRTPESVNLRNYWLSDDPTRLRKARITEDITVPARGFVNLWLGHRDKYYPTQVTLKLDPEGGELYLATPSCQLIDGISYPPVPPRASYARTSDGGREWSLSSTPTPATTNVGMTWCTERLDAPVVTKESQIFIDRLAFNVMIPDRCILRYTTDGSTPTLKNGMMNFTGYFVVTETSVFRFALFRQGCLSSPVVTRTFILRDRDFSLPVIAVATAPQNLYSDTLGIFVRGTEGRPGLGQSVACNWNMDWDRPCNFELFDAEGHSLVNQETEMKRCGGWSRSQTPYTFKIHATKYYEGCKTLDYPFFSVKPPLKHKTLMMRNGGNVDFKCRVKDPFLQQIVSASGLDVDYQEYQPVAHYINGTYMGVINMREPNNKHHVYANYGLDEEEIDLFEMNIDSTYLQLCGDDKAWRRAYNLSSTSYVKRCYQLLNDLLDIDEFCNYMAVELYLGCTDWPQNNLKAFRPRMEGGRFRFILYDLDGALRTDSPFLLFEGKKVYTFHTLYDGPVSRYTKEIDVVTIFCNLLRIESFRKKFIDTFCLVAGSVFEPSWCEELLRRLADRVNDMQVLPDGGYNRNVSPWGTTNTLISSLKDRQATLIQALKEYRPMGLASVDGMQVQLESNLECACLQVNDIVVPTGRFSGTLFPPLKFKASAPQGYRFLGWNQVFDGETNLVSTSPELDVPVTGEDKLHYVACFERVAHADGEKPVVINEVSAANSIYVNEYFKKNDWIELYNLSDEEFDLEGCFLSDDPLEPKKHCITAGTSNVSTRIPAYGHRIVWCDRQPGASQLHADFKLKDADGACVILSAPDLAWSDTLIYCAHDGLQSVGRFPDGGSNLFLMPHPTIERPNAMNSYTRGWDPQTETFSDGVEFLPTHTSGLSLTYEGDELIVGSEDDSSPMLSIYTSGGTRVLARRLTMPLSRQHVGLASLPRGVYIVHLEDREGNRCAIKITKP